MAIELFDQDGSVKQYRLLSERLPEFLAAFPFSEGYRIVVDAKPFAEIVGPDDSAGGIIFTATLYKADLPIANASALRPKMTNLKDWEKGETSARQRLLAACGFGGDVLDADEHADMKDQGLSSKPQGNARQEPAKEPEQIASKPEPEKQQAVLGEKPEPPQQDASEQEKQDLPVQREDIPAALIRQIQHQAKLRGVPCPTPSTKDEAKQELKKLMKR